jgi:hypothetical protein
MPHAVLLGAPPLRDIASAVSPLRAQVEGCTIKSDAAYLELGGRALLVPILTAAGPLRQRFLILCSQRDDGSIAVKLDPHVDPEKTRPVRLALALVTSLLRSRSPGSTLGPTNLGDAFDAVEGA